MNINLFKKIVSIQSTTSNDTAINNFITETISKIDGVVVTNDAFGNIYATKGAGSSGYKCLVCHTDTVHREYSERSVHVSGDVVFCTAKLIDTKYNSEVVMQVGTGGDDRNGIYTCIKGLQDFDNIKAVFFRFEETGCRGSREADMNFFDDCNFAIQCDRRGNSDFITNISGIDSASREFVSTMSDIYSKYGYKETTGLSTDVGALKRNGLKVSAINLSCGYYNPHTEFETCNLKDLQNCYDMVTEMFEKHGNTRFEHKYEPVVYKTYTKSKKEQSLFSFNIKNNFFANNKDVEIEKIESFSFIRIDGTKKYKLIFDECLFYDNLKCPICGDTENIAFYSDLAVFHCTEKSCSEFLINEGLYVNAVIEDGDEKYVYNRFYDVWYNETDAKYNEKLNTYELK